MANDQMTGTLNCHVAFEEYHVSFALFCYIYCCCHLNACLAKFADTAKFFINFHRIFIIIALQGVSFYVTELMYAPQVRLLLI